MGSDGAITTRRVLQARAEAEAKRRLLASLYADVPANPADALQMDLAKYVRSDLSRVRK